MNALAQFHVDVEDEVLVAEPAAEAEVGVVRTLAQVVECADAGLLRHTAFHDVLRVHPSYLEMVGERELPAGTLVECWVDLADGGRKHLVAGRVIRARRDVSGGWLIQLALEATAGTDLRAWREAVA